ncbi:hypothetical protein [Haloarcula sediminis]|uniref:hypothetical protein n=1 Tax=Haloarcula sediminis TaxID=3111777 RepID=UPI002D796576|nr:hypothetical protein [Haloarcula sp. CK38]
MDRRTFIAAASASTVALAGCSTDSGSDSDGEVQPDDSGTGETNVSQTLRVPATDAVAGQTLDAVSATYPRDQFVVESASHDAISLGVDAGDTGTLDEEFDAGAISGVNNNEYSFTVTLDTGYELSADDVVVLDYPAVTNPDDPGEYEVTVGLNDTTETTVTVQIGD